MIKHMLMRKRSKWVLLSWIFGFLLLRLAITVSHYSDDQSLLYNQGLLAAQQGDVDQAVSLFTKSQAAYDSEQLQQQSQWLLRLVYPAADRGLSAQAGFQMAKLFLQAGQLPRAVHAFNQSLQLNPGNDYEALDSSAAERLRRAAMVVKYDLELLYVASKDQMQMPSQSSGPPNDGDPQSSGRDPSNDPGKGQDSTPGQPGGSNPANSSGDDM
ncbi:MAG: tetratricopeptide repeat protein [Cyanobacteria bacterium SZAS-4]|nr:tetratricopeptide repeat protein [Cyanobacteria bacterium SZAS-4]